MKRNESKQLMRGWIGIGARPYGIVQVAMLKEAIDQR